MSDFDALAAKANRYCCVSASSQWNRPSIQASRSSTSGWNSNGSTGRSAFAGSSRVLAVPDPPIQMSSSNLPPARSARVLSAFCRDEPVEKITAIPYFSSNRGSRSLRLDRPSDPAMKVTTSPSSCAAASSVSHSTWKSAAASSGAVGWGGTGVAVGSSPPHAATSSAINPTRPMSTPPRMRRPALAVEFPLSTFFVTIVLLRRCCFSCVARTTAGKRGFPAVVRGHDYTPEAADRCRPGAGIRSARSASW